MMMMAAVSGDYYYAAFACSGQQSHGEPRFYGVNPTQTKVETIWFTSGIQTHNSMTEMLSFWIIIMRPSPAHH